MKYSSFHWQDSPQQSWQEVAAAATVSQDKGAVRRFTAEFSSMLGAREAFALHTNLAVLRQEVSPAPAGVEYDAILAYTSANRSTRHY